MKQIPINYYPLENEGQTLMKAAEKDNDIVYYSKVIYELELIPLLPEFIIDKKRQRGQGQFLLFLANDRINYEVLTSLN